jgi:hypothetical protein
MTLAAIDRTHITKFLTFLQASYPISSTISGGSWGRFPMVHISFRSRRLVNALEQWGLTRDKSRQGVGPLLATNRHFWRGMIDGDGTIRFSVMRFHQKYQYCYTLGFGQLGC